MSEFLRKYAPTFCWVSVNDLNKMFKEYLPNTKHTKYLMSCCVFNLCKQGVLEKKPDGSLNLYRRVK